MVKPFRWTYQSKALELQLLAYLGQAALGFCGGLFGNFFTALLSRAGKRDELAYKHKLDMIAKRQELLLQHRLVMEREAKDSEIVTIRSEVASLKEAVNRLERSDE